MASFGLASEPARSTRRRPYGRCLSIPRTPPPVASRSRQEHGDRTVHGDQLGTDRLNLVPVVERVVSRFSSSFTRRLRIRSVGFRSISCQVTACSSTCRNAGNSLCRDRAEARLATRRSRGCGAGRSARPQIPRGSRVWSSYRSYDGGGVDLVGSRGTSRRARRRSGSPIERDAHRSVAPRPRRPCGRATPRLCLGRRNLPAVAGHPHRRSSPDRPAAARELLDPAALPSGHAATYPTRRSTASLSMVERRRERRRVRGDHGLLLLVEGW